MDGNGQRDGDLTGMNGAARRRWKARRQLDGKGRRDDNSSTAMDDEERHERDGDVDVASGGSNKGQCGIKT
jgi:hypothetical protein